ncbi:hypothetical protein M1328_05525 [Patescibacteria group bacterium]|nr:hypothetical protein [Patescibacteria group bacterium]
MFNNIKIKILLVLVFSFLVVKFASPAIFLANTPRVNPTIVANIFNAPSTLAQLPSSLFSQISNINLFKTSPASNNNTFANIKAVVPAANVIFQPVTQNVSAAENPTTGEKYIQLKAGTKYKISGYVTIDGKQYPKLEIVQ